MNNYYQIIIILCLISSVTRFVLDSYLPSLPAMSEYFAISHLEIQATLTLYLFGFGVSQLIYGPLSDIYGRKKILLLGLGIFIIGNLFCTLRRLIFNSLPCCLVSGRYLKIMPDTIKT